MTFQLLADDEEASEYAAREFCDRLEEKSFGPSRRDPASAWRPHSVFC